MVLHISKDGNSFQKIGLATDLSSQLRGDSLEGNRLNGNKKVEVICLWQEMDKVCLAAPATSCQDFLSRHLSAWVHAYFMRFWKSVISFPACSSTNAANSPRVFTLQTVPFCFQWSFWFLWSCTEFCFLWECSQKTYILLFNKDVFLRSLFITLWKIFLSEST